MRMIIKASPLIEQILKTGKIPKQYRFLQPYNIKQLSKAYKKLKNARSYESLFSVPGLNFEHMYDQWEGTYSAKINDKLRLHIIYTKNEEILLDELLLFDISNHYT